MEEWKEIPGYPRYFSSTLGRILGPSGKILKASNNGHGYWKVSLCVGGKVYQRYVHILTALTWILNPDDLPEVNHKDGITSYNAKDNLEWVTKSGNNLHAFRVLNRQHPSQGKTGKLSKISKEWVVTDPNGVSRVITGLKEFCRENSLDQGAMHRVSTGDRNHHKGWKCQSNDQS